MTRSFTALQQQLEAMFRAEVGAQVRHIEIAIARRDWATVRTAVHYLKSSAGVVRDLRLYETCSTVEYAAEQGNAPRVTRAWAECVAALAKWRGGANSIAGKE